MYTFNGRSAAYSAIIGALFLFSTTARAYDFNYNYVQVSHSSSTTSASGVDVDSSDTGVDVSFEIDENVAIFVGYFTGSIKDYDTDTTELDFGVTLHTPIAPETDGVIAIAMVKVEIDYPPGFVDEDDTGFALQAGIRHAIGEQAELSASFNHIDIFNDTSNSASIGILINLTTTVALLGNFRTGDDTDTIAGAVRIAF